MATIALFVALGGTSVAAVHLAKNSVTSTAIKNGQVKNRDLANNAVTSSKVKDHSLLGKDFKSGQLPQGPKGATGAQGPKGNTGNTGATGPSNGYFSSSTAATLPVAWTTPDSQTLRSLSLPAGKYILNAVVQADNDAATPSTAGCQITINTGSVDGASVRPGVDGSDDQDVIALTGGATLVAPATATLDCSASTAFGTWKSFSLTAIKVASLN
jgi:hypothetical protein